MRYRAEIDGLRTLAVIPVVLFHAGFKTFSGGFVGVDVFFVISGYLITTIILSELDEGKFSVFDFYERRARRILPALFFVMAVCIPFAWMFLTPRDIDYFAKSLIAVTLFSSNILFWRESGYFDTTAELKPLLHTWSLAVEEQYYIFFPLFLMVFWRFGKRWIVAGLVLISLLSLGLGNWASYRYPTPAFYLLPTRGWEILLGVLGAFYLNKKRQINISVAAAELLSFVGVFLIAYSIFSFDSNTPVPGFYSLAPTFGALLIILFAQQGTLVSSLLGNKIVVSLGLISYSLYLWHQPIFAFVKYKFLFGPPIVLMSISVLAVFPISYLTWRFIEVPFRSRLVHKNSVLFKYCLIFSVMIPLGAMLLYSEKNQRFGIDAEAESLNRTEYVNNYCPYRSDDGTCKVDNKKVLIVGDSMWQDALNILWTVHPFQFEVSQRSGCPPHDNIVTLMDDKHPSKFSCQSLNVDRFRQSFDGIYAVVIMNRYGWFKPSDLERYLDFLKKKGVKRILVFGSYFGVDFNMDRLMKYYGDQEKLIGALDSTHLLYRDIQDSEFYKLQERYDFTYVSLLESGCDSRGCEYFFGGIPFTYDVHHLTLEFSKKIAEDNKEKILKFFQADAGNPPHF